MGLHSPLAEARRIGRSAESLLADMPGELADPLFLTYLHGCFAAATQERLHVVYCDSDHRYLHDETLIVGGETSLVLRARPLIHRALAVGAGSLVLAHNHLSGQCRPSEADILATHRLQELGAAVELELIDHLIFTRERFFSMAAGGLLR